MLVPITGIIYLRFTISEFYFKAWRYIGQLRRHFSTITKQSPETKKNVLMNEGAVRAGIQSRVLSNYVAFWLNCSLPFSGPGPKRVHIFNKDSMFRAEVVPRFTCAQIFIRGLLNNIIELFQLGI